MQNTRRKILLVDDDKVDAMIIERSLKKNMADLDLSWVVNGQEAVDLLVEGYNPDIIIMDIRMPVMDGLQALCKIKNSQDFRSIPIIMTSTSSDQSDIDFCYQNHANAYMVKAHTISETETKTKQLVDFWLRTAS